MKRSKVEAWRSQEQALLERWNAAAERHRAAHTALAAHGGGAPDETLVQEVKASLAEIEALRRQVARLKREFLTGDRY